MNNHFFSLAGKVAIVTGAGRGLGRAIALRLAQAGATVCVNDIDPHTCEAVRAEIAEAGGQASSFAANVTDQAAVIEMIDHVCGRFGGVDILVNNAGISVAEDIFECTLESWRKVLDVNLTGAFLCSKYALEKMRDAGKGGRIIMMGSVVGHQGALKGWVHYGASKSGLHGLAKSMTRMAADYDVTVNCVAPGIVETELLYATHTDVPGLMARVPARRLSSTEDVAGAVHYLASDEASYVTGANLDINGGLYIRP